MIAIAMIMGALLFAAITIGAWAIVLFYISAGDRRGERRNQLSAEDIARLAGEPTRWELWEQEFRP